MRLQLSLRDLRNTGDDQGNAKKSVFSEVFPFVAISVGIPLILWWTSKQSGFNP